MRDAMTAMRTASMLLNGVTGIREIKVADGAHAYSYKDRLGQKVVVAWADDANGADAGVNVKLPLFVGSTWYERVEWDYSATGPNGGRAVKNDLDVVELTTTPTFFRDLPAH